jgi:hypothetical protein
MKGCLLATIVYALLVIIMLALVPYRPTQNLDIIPSGRAEVVTIQTANPYRFSVRLEVKCDWDWQKGRYRFHQFIVVPGKQQTQIKVPNNLRFCEIWPKILF